MIDVDAMVRLSAFGTDGVAVSAASVILDRIYTTPAEFVPGLLELRYG
jgi:hypothetical protein